jgi:indole-3-glycerol phosphate synthase
VLEDLFAQALADAKQREQLVSAAALEARIETLSKAVDARAALARGERIKVIAEIKRRSPSKGFLAEIPSAASQAASYQRGGASAISVLTEPSGFGGSLADLEAARAAVGLPLLRKDFISNEYQLLEARAFGADFALLIASWLSPQRYRELLAFAFDLGLQVLTETHSAAEIDVAANAGAQIIGINTRDLNTFETDINLFAELAASLPTDVVKVAESSVRTVQDVIDYRAAGADCVLIGEALVRGDAERLLAEFTAVGA